MSIDTRHLAAKRQNDSIEVHAAAERYGWYVQGRAGAVFVGRAEARGLRPGSATGELHAQGRNLSFCLEPVIELVPLLLTAFLVNLVRPVPHELFPRDADWVN